MENIVIAIHLVVALAIIGLILMQQGKGAEAGASFGGGASQTVFGSQGGGNFFAKATAVLAFVFFATSFSLAIIAKNKTGISIDDGIPNVAEQILPESELPTIGVKEALESELPNVEQPTTEAIEDSIKAELPTVPQDDSAK